MCTVHFFETIRFISLLGLWALFRVQAMQLIFFFIQTINWQISLKRKIALAFSTLFYFSSFLVGNVLLLILLVSKVLSRRLHAQFLF